MSLCWNKTETVSFNPQTCDSFKRLLLRLLSKFLRICWSLAHLLLHRTWWLGIIWSWKPEMRSVQRSRGFEEWMPCKTALFNAKMLICFCQLDAWQRIHSLVGILSSGWNRCWWWRRWWWMRLSHSKCLKIYCVTFVVIVVYDHLHAERQQMSQALPPWQLSKWLCRSRIGFPTHSARGLVRPPVKYQKQMDGLDRGQVQYHQTTM